MYVLITDVVSERDYTVMCMTVTIWIRFLTVACSDPFHYNNQMHVSAPCLPCSQLDNFSLLLLTYKDVFMLCFCSLF